MKDRKENSRVPILAAGGIVLRNDHALTPQFAVVQSRKLQTWGLPKGKLAAGEDAMTAARREVLEETGHRVTVHEFLGTLVYETSNRAKAVQFWRMEAAGPPAGDLMRDVVAVEWLALTDAIERLSHMRERVFLDQVGPVALKLAARPAASVPFQDDAVRRPMVPGVPLAPTAEPLLIDDVELPPVPPATIETAPSPMTETLGECLTGKNLMKKTWGWFRHAALLQRHLPD
jgi:8-oxo-dGTP diphosphatase